MEVDVVRATQGQDPGIIFDVGANAGQTARRFAKTFPDARIFSFEPVPATFAQLKEAAAPFPQVKTFNLALGSSQETIEIPLRESSTHNTLRHEGGTFVDTASPETGEMVKVQVETIAEICAREHLPHIDLLKTDTEGFDLEVVKGAEPLILAGKIPFIYAETGLQPGDDRWTPFPAFRDWLAERGYRLYGQYEFCRYENPATPHYLGLAFCNSLFVNPAALKARFQVG
jgi:FkbM family methyltransferase